MRRAVIPVHCYAAGTARCHRTQASSLRAVISLVPPAPVSPLSGLTSRRKSLGCLTAARPELSPGCSKGKVLKDLSDADQHAQNFVSLFIVQHFTSLLIIAYL